MTQVAVKVEQMKMNTQDDLSLCSYWSCSASSLCLLSVRVLPTPKRVLPTPKRVLFNPKGVLFCLMPNSSLIWKFPLLLVQMLSLLLNFSLGLFLRDWSHPGQLTVSFHSHLLLFRRTSQGGEGCRGFCRTHHTWTSTWQSCWGIWFKYWGKLEV